MSTTIKDFGRHSDKFGDIAHYYAFPIRFWFGNHQLAPDDVLSWLRDNAKGYYKVVCYTHKDSVRVKGRPASSKPRSSTWTRFTSPTNWMLQRSSLHSMFAMFKSSVRVSSRAAKRSRLTRQSKLMGSHGSPFQMEGE